MRIGYGRTSKDDQEAALQEDALQAAGCEVVYLEVVSRDGPKRRKHGTPELDAALKSLRPGDTFIVWRLDRLSGSLSELIRILEGLRDRGVLFESLTEKIDTSTAHGELLFHVTGAFAQFERRLIVERTKAGLAAARRRGRIGGRRRVLDAEKIKQLRALLADSSLTRAEVARMMKISRTTLYNYIAELDAEKDR